ncbi:phage virion morphogenesis protein [Enterobacter ludwigii]|uniref:phage virion morphogenesis protein n=1 Tax=Enterobacter ludwigii TaxID=299767 RepID=UPI001866C9B0|nr:phage virion morphogenesis protein [Enterobacter ludwigii]
MLSDNFHLLDASLQGLLNALTPVSRKRMNMLIARELRRENQKHIAQQKNPDESPFIARKRLRDKRGRIRRAMFAKLRTAKYMKVSATADEAAVYFTGHQGYIARTHQYGLEDTVSRDGPRVKYPARRLLGFGSDSIRQVERQIIDHLSKHL